MARFLCALLLGALGANVGAQDMSSCNALRAEMLRRQVAERGELTMDPYDARALGNSEHSPYLRVEGTNAMVITSIRSLTADPSDPLHPTSSTHWIDTIWVENQDGEIIAMRRPMFEPPPAKMVFPIPNGTTSMVPYLHCNIHGTFKGPPVTIAGVQTAESNETSCRVTSCDGSESSFCAPMIVEYQRLYNTEFSTDVPKVTSIQHKPNLQIHGNGSASVQVGGVGGKYHPMASSDNPDLVHWINAVWVYDQDGKLAAMKELRPSDPAPVILTFEIPAGTTSLTPYIYCNKHGLYTSPTVPVSSAALVASPGSGVCTMFDCADGNLTYARDADCGAIKAVALKRQATLNAAAPAAFPVPYGTEATNATNTPYVVLEGTLAKVVVGRGGVPGQEGQPVHPMIGDPSDAGKNMHFIETVWVEDQDGKVLGLRRLSPSEPGTPTLYFDIPMGTTAVTPYALCNKEGLFQGPEVAVAAANTVVGARAGCSMQQCIEGTAVSACQAFSSDFYRREGIAAAKPSTDLEHMPYVTVTGTSVNIVVGPGAAPGGSGYIHPMNYSSDPESVHYISYIFVTDAFYNLVAMCELLPMEPEPAACNFEVPPGVNQLRPHVYCTRHGLFQGPPVTVVQSNPLAQRMCFKRECSEAQPSLSATAMSNLFVQDRLDSIADSLDRINTINMCEEHRAVFSVRRNVLTSELLEAVERLTRDGDAASDTKRRLEAYGTLLPQLKALGGSWHALPEVFDHVGLADAELRLDIIGEELMRFQTRNLSAGVAEIVPGVEDPILDEGADRLLIEASFAMDWGYDAKTVLNAHFTAFHSINFEGEYVDVALCAKTHGWLGMGWLSPDHSGHAMNHTDITVAYVKDGQAYVEDRFAFSTEEPTKDDVLPNQRVDAEGRALNGVNDLELVSGALGAPGKEWCPDAKCSPGFTLVQFRKRFKSEDAWDVQLTSRLTKVLIIFSFAIDDPTEFEMLQHAATSTGYGALLWNRKCAAGTYFNTDRGDCVSCDPGSFQPAYQEITSCLSCPKGTFQEVAGKSSCERCKPNFSTASVGSSDQRSCTCSGPLVTQLDGWYHVPACGAGPNQTEDGEPLPCSYLGECVQCPSGMLCEGGVEILPELVFNAEATQRVEDYCDEVSATLFDDCTSRDFCAEYLGDPMCGHTRPKLKQGYSSLPADPYSVYLCKDLKACPGGLPGTCGASRDNTSVACGECVANSYQSGGECYPCGDSSNMLPFVAAAAGLLVGLTCLALFMNKAIYMRAGVATTAGILAGTTFSALQTMTTFATLKLSWIPSVEQFLVIVGIASFNPEVIRPGCVAEVSPEAKMLGRVLVLPFSLAWLALVLYVRKRVRKTNTFLQDYANTVGAIASVFFIPIVLSFLAPFICYPHPNGTQSMVSAPSILCYDDPSYGKLIVMGVLSFQFIALPFLAFVVYGTWKYRENLILQDVDKLGMFRFLFIRFKPDRYYFGVIVLGRNLLICLVPILTSKSPAMQALIMCLVLQLFMLLQVWFKPWRPDPSQVKWIDANKIDAGLVSGCILLLLCGVLTTDFETSRTSVSTFSYVILGLIAGSIVSTIVVTTWQRFFPAPFYKWTIAHDAAAGVAQARLLKMLVTARTQSQVLLDSEVVAESDVVFDTIRVRTGTLVVYGTRDVLRRQRVAGEITVASNMKVPMLFIRCAEFLDLTDQDFENLEDYLEPSRSLLAAYGMSFVTISEAFRFLLDPKNVPCMAFPGDGGLYKYDALADSMFTGAEVAGSDEKTGGKKLLLEEVKGLTPSRTVVICSDAQDEEATAVVGIMSVLMRRMNAERSAAFLLMVECVDIEDALIGQEAGQEIEQTMRVVLSQARAVLVLLSKATLRSPTQSFVIAEAMLTFPNMNVSKPGDDGMSETRSNASSNRGSDTLHVEGRQSSKKLDRVGNFMRKRRQVSYKNQVVVPVVLPGYRVGPTEKWYAEVLPGMLPNIEDGGNRIEAAKQFFTRSSVNFDPQMGLAEMSLQLADIWERIPEEGDPMNQQQFSSFVV